MKKILQLKHKKTIKASLLVLLIYAIISTMFHRCNKHIIYLDNNSTTQVDVRVVRAMQRNMLDQVGNPSSTTHLYGRSSRNDVEKARSHIADFIGADEKEIFFTSGATESGNLAIKGYARYNKSPKKKHIITTAIEHKCILNSTEELEEEGFDVTYIKPNRSGVVDVADIEKAIRKDTMLISVMYINNEVGSVQPIKKIGLLAKKHNIAFHVDAAQAFGKININVKDLNIDMMSVSGHKFYGPKGIGFLYINSNPQIHISSIFSGGGQERGVRSGTLPVPLIAGLDAAVMIAKKEMKKDMGHIAKMRSIFLRELQDLDGFYINGDEVHGYPGNINISFDCLESGKIIEAVYDELAISSSSACGSNSFAKDIKEQTDITAKDQQQEESRLLLEQISQENKQAQSEGDAFCSKCSADIIRRSYVLRAMGLPNNIIKSAIRVGIGKFNTEAEVKKAANILKSAVIKLRKKSTYCVNKQWAQ